MLWHQSVKSIHVRALLIFQNKKNNRLEGQNMGGIKDMLSPPPMSKHGGYITPTPPPHSPRIYALGLHGPHPRARDAKVDVGTISSCPLDPITN